MTKEEVRELLNDDETIFAIQDLLSYFGEQYFAAEEWNMRYNPDIKRMEPVRSTVNVAVILKDINDNLHKIASVLGG